MPTPPLPPYFSAIAFASYTAIIIAAIFSDYAFAFAISLSFESRYFQTF
jgi:hypothetical protein